MFPVGGWWKEIGAQLDEELEVRYSLIISLEVHSDVDDNIYAPIAAQIASTVPVAIGNP